MTDTEGTPQKQQHDGAKNQRRAKFLTAAIWAKEQYEAYKTETYRRCKEWFQRPWWFQETEPLAKFTGWVAAYTGVLVVVSALQYCTLANTDKTTRDALIAANRAWLGPINAKIEGAIEKGKPVKVEIDFRNTGKSPALHFAPLIYEFTFDASTFSQNKAIDVLKFNGKQCSVIDPVEGANVVFPETTGGQALHFPGASSQERGGAKMPEPVIADDDIVNGQKLVAVFGCFAYMTLQQPHHSAFCYYYRAGTTNPNALSFCPSGHYAD